MIEKCISDSQMRTDDLQKIEEKFKLSYISSKCKILLQGKD
jgi:hypothetical protein